MSEQDYIQQAMKQAINDKIFHKRFRGQPPAGIRSTVVPPEGQWNPPEHIKEAAQWLKQHDQKIV